MRITDDYVFFFGQQDIYSNWHLADFEYRGITFNCVEQFMMYSKAMLFGDKRTAEKILKEKKPKKQKELGRLVTPFDKQIWDNKSPNIVAVGCRESFSQNPEKGIALLATEKRILVEASPYDGLWGVRLGENDPRIENPKNWQGDNLLGDTLMHVRTILASDLSWLPPTAKAAMRRPGA